MVGYLGSLRGLGRGSSVTGWVLLTLTRKLLSLTQALFIICDLGQVINLPMPQFLHRQNRNNSSKYLKEQCLEDCLA